MNKIGVRTFAFPTSRYISVVLYIRRSLSFLILMGKKGRILYLSAFFLTHTQGYSE